MWVKICGNTRLQDCVLAAELGADAVGFIFADGKRTVTAEQVAGITSELPDSLEKIGVFTSADAQTITQAVKSAGLTGIQLHDAYDPTLVRELRSYLAAETRLLQVIHWDLDLPAEAQMATFAADVQRAAAEGLIDALLVDSRTAQRSGGTGQTFDWKAAASALATVPVPVIVAGGLNPGNVADAMATLHPWGVDVSSGIEEAPGVKDAEALQQFVETARATRA